jgi:hypothetical protein
MSAPVSLEAYATVRPLGDVVPELTRQGSIAWSRPDASWCLYATPHPTETHVSVTDDEGYEYAMPDAPIWQGTSTFLYRGAVAAILSRRWSVDGGEPVDLQGLLDLCLGWHANVEALGLDAGEHAGRFVVSEDAHEMERLLRS